MNNELNSGKMDKSLEDTPEIRNESILINY